MFLSNNSCSSTTTDQPSMFHTPLFFNDVSPSHLFKQYHHQNHQPPPSPPHSSFFHFSPSTFLDHNYEDENVWFNLQPHHHQQDLLFTHDHLQQQQQQPPLITTTTTTTTVLDPTTTTTTTCTQTLPEGVTDPNNMIISSSSSSKMIKTSWSNKRCSSSSKKDRHSKIVTAQGPRDRRMRLSLKVARPFFTLQDMLGFDKASKTVEWLLMNCNSQINELKRSLLLTTKGSCVSYTSDCEEEEEEVVCDEIDHMISNTTTTTTTDQDHDHQRRQGNDKKEKYRARLSRKPPTFAKESRAKARAKARERTIGKIWSRSISIPPTQYHHHPQGLTNNLNQFIMSSTTSPFEFETGDDSGSQSHDMKSSLEVVEPSSQSLEDSIVITSNSSAGSHQILNYDHQQEIKYYTSQGLNNNLNNNNNNNSSSTFAENWDMDEASANSSFCATSTNINVSTGNVHDPISSPFRLTTSDVHRLPSHHQFVDFQFFDKQLPWQTYNSTESP